MDACASLSVIIVAPPEFRRTHVGGGAQLPASLSWCSQKTLRGYVTMCEFRINLKRISPIFISAMVAMH